MSNPLVIPAGTLRSPVEIQSRSTAKDEFGQPTETWTPILSTRAAIRTLTLSERSNASGFISQATHRITLRYQASTPLTAGMRIVYGSRVFILQAVDNVQERNRVITCLALELEPTQ